MKKRVGSLHIYDDRLVHYGKDGIKTAKLVTRNFPSVPAPYYDLEDIVLELPVSAKSGRKNADQFVHDWQNGKLGRFKGKYAAYLNGVYRGNLDNPGVLYFMVRQISGRRYLDIFRVPALEEGADGLKESLREAILSERPQPKEQKDIEAYKEPRYKTHAEI